MKKFTLVVALLAFALFGKAEISTDLQKKVLKVKAKTDQILQKNALLMKNSGVSKYSAHKLPIYLNSTETQKLDSIVSWTYDEDNSVWKYQWMDIYEYDAQMKNTFWHEKEWNEEKGTWELWSQTEMVYGTDGQLNYLLIHAKDEQTGNVFIDAKWEVFLNKDAGLDSMVTYIAFPDESWMAVATIKHFYDGSGHLILSETWTMQVDEDGLPTANFVLFMVTNYEYNGSAKIILVSNSYYIEGEEMPSSQIEYVYNSSGQLTSAISSRLISSTLQFENYTKFDYNYNSEGDIDTEIESNWNSTSKSWMEKTKHENNYSNDNFSDVAFPSIMSMIFGTGDPETGLFNKVIISDKSYEMVGDSWVQTDKSTFYYSSGTTNVIDFDNPSISFYPNPTSENITLKWNGAYKNLNVQIFQINGAKVMEQIAYPEENILISNLARGIYLVKLQSGQQNVYTGKLVKK